MKWKCHPAAFLAISSKVQFYYLKVSKMVFESNLERVAVKTTILSNTFPVRGSTFMATFSDSRERLYALFF